MFVVSSDFSRTHSPDTPGYMELAENYNVAYFESNPKFVNSSLLRTPGYPTLLAISQTNGKQHQWIILILQMLISIGTICLTYYFTKHLLGKPAALIAALLLTIDPVSLTYIYYLRNEVLFTFLLVAGTGLWLLCIQKVNFPQMAFAGFLIGLATLTRPVSLYFPLFLLAGTLMLIPVPFSRRLLLSCLLITGFMLPVGGWMARNKVLSGSGMLSSIQGINILYYRAAGAIAEETGKSRRAVEFELKEMMTDKYNLNLSQWRTEPNPGRINQLNQQEGLRLLLAHPKGMMISTLKGCGRLLFGPGTTALQKTFGLNSHSSYQRYLFQGTLVVITLFITIAAMWGVGMMMRNKLWVPLLSLAAVIVYFVMISSGPEAHSRFRAPIMPFFCLLAGYGISVSINRRENLPSKQSTTEIRFH